MATKFFYLLSTGVCRHINNQWGYPQVQVGTLEQLGVGRAQCET